NTTPYTDFNDLFFFVMCTVFILFSISCGTFYVGYPGVFTAPTRRTSNLNHKGFTGKSGDWTLVYSEQYDVKESATFRERQIKGWKSRKLIEKLIGSAHSDL